MSVVFAHPQPRNFENVLGYMTNHLFQKYGSAEAMEIIDLLCLNGARWEPVNRKAITKARRALLKLAPTYTVELVQTLLQHSACSMDTIAQLLNTPTIQKHLTEHARQLAKAFKKYERRQDRKK